MHILIGDNQGFIKCLLSHILTKINLVHFFSKQAYYAKNEPVLTDLQISLKKVLYIVFLGWGVLGRGDLPMVWFFFLRGKVT